MFGADNAVTTLARRLIGTSIEPNGIQGVSPLGELKL